jgi:hypothetical protein
VIRCDGAGFRQAGLDSLCKGFPGLRTQLRQLRSHVHASPSLESDRKLGADRKPPPYIFKIVKGQHRLSILKWSAARPGPTFRSCTSSAPVTVRCGSDLLNGGSAAQWTPGCQEADHLPRCGRRAGLRALDTLRRYAVGTSPRRMRGIDQARRCQSTPESSRTRARHVGRYARSQRSI